MRSSLTTSSTTATSTIHHHRHQQQPPASLLNQLKFPCFFVEPTSVLDLCRSPSPSNATATSATTLSPSLTASGSVGGGCGDSDGIAAVAAVSNLLSDETQLPWARETAQPSGGLPPDFGHPSQSEIGPPMEDLDSMLMAVSSPPQEPSLIRWIFSEKDDSAPPQPLLFPHMPAQEEAVVDSQMPFNSHPPNSFLLPDAILPYPCALPTIYDSATNPAGINNPSLDDLYLKQMQFQAEPTSQPAQFFRSPPSKPGSDGLQVGAIDQLVEAAGFVEAGNLALAQAILARLNQVFSPFGKPLNRAAYYFKEALLLSLSGVGHHHHSSFLSPIDLVHKIGAYKSFSEVSPLPQFANFTANQALLEALDGADSIHIVDFDIGLGGQWASFMQELAVKPRPSPPSLRVTAVVPSDSMEVRLARDNLCHFAQELSVPFRFDAVTFRRFESLCLDALAIREGEVVAVNFSPAVQRELSRPDSVSGFLRFLKRLGPRIAVFVDAECERGEASFRRQFAGALEFYAALMDSLDAAGIDPDSARRIDRYLLQPRINGSVASRWCRPSPPSVSPERTLPWRSLFGRAGFAPVPFSNFTETQADYLVKRTQVKGFHVEKHNSSLLLCWQRRELVATSAWRCC
ncbi:unnamed protein product [Victoria cruziana]